MLKILSPIDTIRYFEILLDDLSLDTNGRCIVTAGYVFMPFAGISMPPVDVNCDLSSDQIVYLNDLILQNLNSSKYRFTLLLSHWRLKSSRIRNSKALHVKQREWQSEKESVSNFFSDSPLGIVEDRLNKFLKRAAYKSLPGYKPNMNFTSYLSSVDSRLFSK